MGTFDHGAWRAVGGPRPAGGIGLCDATDHPGGRTRPYVPTHPVEFANGTPRYFGPFRVTPHLVEHSAYDAHAIEVEAGGKRLFYSGDIHGHGRKAALFEKLVSHPPKKIDVMLMASFGRLGPDRSFPTESEIEQRLVELFGQASGLALIAASARNINHMVSL
ncbi:MAG TPA: hypothetical protein VGJ68_04195 [Bradyrhizobium sp.]|jgi:ribonuclease J